MDALTQAEVPHHQRRGRRRRAGRRGRRRTRCGTSWPPPATRPAGRRPHPGRDHAVRRQRRAGHRHPVRRPGLPRRPARACPTPADQVLQLDDTTGLNPSLQGLSSSCTTASSWPSCAASATRSRTAATSARWTSGRPRNPARPGNTGWLGRWLDTVGGDPRLAVSFEPVLPPLLAGATQRRRLGPGRPARKAAQGGDRPRADRAGQAVARRAGAAGPGGRAASPTCSRSTR